MRPAIWWVNLSARTRKLTTRNPVWRRAARTRRLGEHRKRGNHVVDGFLGVADSI
jgi:hypothetical protein